MIGFMKIWQRILLFVAVFVCVLTLPWWLSAFALACLTIFVPNYLEVMFFGFLFDTLYSSGHIGLIASTIFLIIVLFVKPRIRT